MENKHIGTGDLSDIDSRRLIRAGSIWYTPMVEKCIWGFVAAGIMLALISVAEV